MTLQRRFPRDGSLASVGLRPGLELASGVAPLAQEAISRVRIFTVFFCGYFIRNAFVCGLLFYVGIQHY